MIILDGLLALFLTSNFENVLPVLGVTCLITFLRMMMKFNSFMNIMYREICGEEENEKMKEME